MYQIYRINLLQHNPDDDERNRPTASCFNIKLHKVSILSLLLGLLINATYMYTGGS